MRLSTRLFRKSQRPSRAKMLNRVKRPALSLCRLEDRAVPATISGNVFRDANNDGTLNGGEPGIAGQTVFIDTNNDGVQFLDLTGPTSFPATGSYPLAIPPGGADIEDPLTVSGTNVNGRIYDIDLTVDITHPWVGDVFVSLVAPDGTTVTVFGDFFDPFGTDLKVTFDDEAPTTVPNTGGTGTFKPINPLSTFDNMFADGVWKLKCNDIFPFGDDGFINSWSLNITTNKGEISITSNASGDYAFTGMADGTYNVRNLAKSGNFITAPSPDSAVPPAANFTGGTHVVTIAGNVDVGGKNFGQLEANTIQGRVFEDRNNDGVFGTGDIGLAGRFVFRDTNSNGKLDGAVVSKGTTGLVPDNSTVDFFTSVTGFVGNVTNIAVKLNNIKMTFDADLVATLIGPDGTSVELFANIGGGSDDFINCVIDDLVGTVTIGDSAMGSNAPFTGTWKSVNPLAAFNGFNGAKLNGTWTLRLEDQAFADQANVNDWTISITTDNVADTNPAEPNTTTDAKGFYQLAGPTGGGAFEIGEVTPSGWNRLAPAGIITGSLVNGKASVGHNFTEARQNAIYGNVYDDLDLSNTLSAGDAGLQDVIVFIDADADGKFDNPRFKSGNVPVAILDNSTATSTITISSFVGNINDLNVTVDITHTWVADLTISLVAPDGITSIELLPAFNGFGSDLSNTTFDDQAATPISSTFPPYSGTFKPSQPLSVVNGTSPNGVWTLKVVDAALFDIGTINSWSLNINPETNVRSDFNGDYTFTNVAAGTFDVRHVTPFKFLNNSDPVGGAHNVTMAAGGTIQNRNFGHVVDPAPYVASVTAANITLPEGTTHTVTVVYQDDVNSKTINASSIDPGDIRILAPDGITYLIPTKATATPNTDAQTISVDYEFPAWGGSWNSSDNGVYEVELKANEVFDKDGTGLPAVPNVYGSFNVNITPNQIRGTTYFDANKNLKMDAGDTPVANVRIYDDLNNNGKWDDPTFPSTNVPVDIVDFASSKLTISGFVGTISDLNVKINISHTWVGDLDIFLVAPDGVTEVELSTGNGFFGMNYTETIFDDTGANGSVTAGFAPFTGSYIPESPLSVLNGTDPNGTWTLRIEDTFVGADTGTINGWNLIIDNKVPEPNVLSNAAGEYIFTLPDGAHNIRSIAPPLLVPSGDPAGNIYNITLNKDSTINRNFGHFTDPTPLAKGSAVNVKVAGGATHTITVVYTDPEGAKLIDYSSIGVGDVRVKAPDGSYLIPLSATPNPDPMGNAETISVDYVIPAFGADGKWDVTDDGVYSIEVLGSQVFDKDTPTPLSVLPATIGQFKVVIPRNLVVTNVNDSGAGSLRQAIIDAGALESLDSITFAPGVTGKIDLLSRLPNINDSVNIIGPGASKLTISGGTTLQIVRVVGPGTLDVTISGLTFSDGKASGSANQDQGGAIYVGDENLTLVDCVLSGNVSGANGGALYQGTFPFSSPGNLTVINSTFDNNTSNGFYQAGGAIASNSTGTITISRSTFTNNTQTQDGGGGAIGLYSNVTLNIVDSTFSGNSAKSTSPYGFGYGGAILAGLSNPTITVTNSTFSANNAKSGGAISSLFASPGFTLNIRNSTFTLNAATADGGAIYMFDTLETLNISNSIIAQNTSPTSPDVSGTVTTATYNLIGATDGSTGFTDPSNITGTIAVPQDAKLGPLALNGAPPGSPFTHRPMVGSPAIDAGKNDAASAKDGRGFNRTYDNPAVPNAVGGDGTDIGAVELQPPPTVVTILTNGAVGGQRSKVTSIVVTFDQYVTFTNPATAFKINRYDGALPGDVPATGDVAYDVSGLDASNGGSSVTITFKAGGAIGVDPGNSLLDGKYNITVFAANVDGPEAKMAVNANQFTWRLFGDANGDGQVNSADFALFRTFFGLPFVPNSPLDFNGDNSVGNLDFAQFRRRFGLTNYNVP